MWNDSSNNKKFIRYFIFIVVLIFGIGLNCRCGNVAYAKSGDDIESELSDQVDDLLNDIDSSKLDEYLSENSSLEFLNFDTFKDFVSAVLSGSYTCEYDSVITFTFDYLKSNVRPILSFIILVLCVIILHEMFNGFCVDKYKDLKKVVRIIFAMVLSLIVLILMKDLSDAIYVVLEKVFNFTKILFPIILNLVMLAGAAGTFASYSGVSVFLLNTVNYVFVYVLLPLSISMLILTVFGSMFSSKRFTKTMDIFKSIFKFIAWGLFAIFGLLSVVNLTISGMKDGVSLKLTKYAIKNYIPILGGYISDGFDFVRTGSILIKNAFGLCGILVLVFILIKPLLLYFLYLISFKIIALFSSYLNSGYYSNMFDNISKCIGYFISILAGVFFIFFIFIYLIIISVSVV